MKVYKYNYSIRKLYFGNLVLKLYCYCGGNVIYRPLSKHLF